MNTKIKLYWTRSHVENLGNEHADELAKLATLQNEVDRDFRLNNQTLRKKYYSNYMVK